MFILKTLEETVFRTLVLTKKIVDTMREISDIIKTNLPKIYSRRFVDVLFSNVYTKISSLTDKKIASRNIASKYLKELENIGIVKKQEGWQRKDLYQ